MRHITTVSVKNHVPVKAQNLLAKELWIRNARESAGIITAWLAIPQLLLDLLDAVAPGNN